MSTSEFGREYSALYDLIYSDKDYDRECDLVESIFKRYAPAPVRTLLDMGCGTGNHAFRMADRGYEVTGVDRSGEMIARATAKARARSARHDIATPVFHCADLRATDLGRRYDAALMMFAVLGYQLTNNDVLTALRAARLHLQTGGVFVCDVWYGPAVLAMRPADRVKVVPLDDGTIIRTASGVLDTFRHLVAVEYHTWQVRRQGVTQECRESHSMRFFFPQELDLFLSSAGFELLEIRRFDSVEKPPDESSWNVLVVGRARG